MKFVLILYILSLCGSVSFASPHKDSLITELNQAIKNATVYDENKVKDIARIKNELNTSSLNNIKRQYDVNLKLYDEYKYYNYDTALIYANALQRTAYQKNDLSLFTDAKLKTIFILLSSGMFKETFDSLQSISIQNVSETVKADYYSLMGRAYYNLSDFNGGDSLYNNRANLYLDSALHLYPVTSFEHSYYSALIHLKKRNTDSALFYLTHLLERKDLSYHQIALATSTIGGIYVSNKDENKAIPYLARASEADIKSSTKETLALLTLAGIIYKQGRVEEALLYIEKANADAVFYNARLRKVQVGAVLPIIEGGMITTIKNQKEKLQYLLLALSVLVILLATFAIIIRNQVKKLKAARKSLSEVNVKQHQINQELQEANELKEKYNHQLRETNGQLIEANAIKEEYNRQLQQINHRLSEANKIKEEYIGYYFNLDTEYLSRIEKLITSLDKKVTERKWDEIRFILKSVDPKKEKEELLKNFDKAFLRLFPNFVAQFNTLFKEEDKIILKDDQLLNTELRIFALIRLGVTENEKIAEILDYSINTIYAKKTKVRAKTIVSKDDFEKRIAEITAISL